MADEGENNSSSEEDTNDCKLQYSCIGWYLTIHLCVDFKNPMKRRIHDIQKLNLQNKEMLMVSPTHTKNYLHGY